MDPRYFQSRYFVISAIIAVGIVAAAASAYSFVEGGTFSYSGGCSEPELPGRALALAAPVSTEDDRSRTLEQTANATDYDAVRLDLCVAVGEIIIEPTSADSLTATWLVEADDRSAVEGTDVLLSFRDDAGTLVIAAWEPQVGRSTTVFGDRGTVARLTVHVPMDLLADVRAHVDVGDVHASGIRASALDMGADVGSVVANLPELQGDARMSADVGDVTLSLGSVQGANLTLSADIGSVELELPSRADIGYDVSASTDIGDVRVNLGETERYDRQGEGPGSRVDARSSGYATKPTQVKVRATTDVGNIGVVVA